MHNRGSRPVSVLEPVKVSAFSRSSVTLCHSLSLWVTNVLHNVHHCLCDGQLCLWGFGRQLGKGEKGNLRHTNPRLAIKLIRFGE